MSDVPVTTYGVQMLRPTISGTNVTVQAVASGQQLPHQVRRPVQMIPKVLLKCASREDKKEAKTFTIRNINSSVVKICETLKSLIKAQLGEEVVKDFDIGYQHGTAIVNMRTSDDLQEVWSNILKGTRVVLWCNGLNNHSKELFEDSEDDIVSLKPKRKKRK
jgi:hypothetical protein